MKALDPEKQLRRDGEKGGGGGGTLHKPNESAKQQAFEKHAQPGRPKKPKNKKNNDSHKGVIIGAAAAGAAVIGIGAVVAHNMNGGSKTASEKANEHSKDTGLSFGDDDDDSSSSKKSKSKDKSKSKSKDGDDFDLSSDSSSKSGKGKSGSKSKKSKSKLDSLLDGDDDDSSTLVGDALGGVNLGGGSSKSLSALAAKAKKSASSAKALGSTGASSSSSAGKSAASGKGGSSSASSGKGGKSGISAGPQIVSAANRNPGGTTITSLSNKSKGNGNGSTKAVSGKTTLVSNGGAGKAGNGSGNGGKTAITVPDNGGTQNAPSSEPSKGSGSAGNGAGSSGSSSKPGGSDSGSKGGGASDSGKDSGKSDNAKPAAPVVESKTISYIDDDGNYLGKGKLTKTTANGKSTYSLDSSVPNGYWVADNSQLANYPNSVVVKKSSQTTDGKGNSLVSQKIVSYVDKESGKTVGQGIIYKWKSADGKEFCTADGLPVGYLTVSTDADVDKYPDQIYVKEGSNSSYPADDIKTGTTKKVDMVLEDGTKVGTATLTKTEDGVECKLDSDEYRLSDLDSEGESDQLLDWPDKVTVVKKSSAGTGTGGDIDDQPVVKTIALVDKDGKQVGSVTLQQGRDGKWALTGSLPDGYELDDIGAVASGPSKLVVVKKGGSASGGDSTSPTTPVASKTVTLVDESGNKVGSVTLQQGSNGEWTVKGSLPDGYEFNDASAVASGPDQLVVIKKGGSGDASANTKSVSFVDESGKELGKGTLTKGADGKWTVVESTLPDGYKVKDQAATAAGPDKVTVVKVDTSAKPSTESKKVSFVTDDGKDVGTSTLTRTSDGKGGYVYSLEKGAPYGYKLKNGKNALNGYPDKIVVVADDSVAKPGTYTKTAACVTADGKQVGKVTLVRTVASDGSSHVAVKGSLPSGYQMLNNDSSPLKSYPDKITVEKVTELKTQKFKIAFVDSAGKTLKTGNVTIITYSDYSHKYMYDTTMPDGYVLDNPDEQMIDPATHFAKADLSKVVMTKAK